MTPDHPPPCRSLVAGINAGPVATTAVAATAAAATPRPGGGPDVVVEQLGVDPQPPAAAAGDRGHVQRGDDQSGVVVGAHRVAEDAPGVQVDDGGQVDVAAAQQLRGTSLEKVRLAARFWTFLEMIPNVAVAVVLLALNSEFLFAITFLMMIGEMMIMVMFMVAFMMNPAGLNPMRMVHQPRVAAGAGLALFLLLASAIVSADFPEPQAAAPEDVAAAIGHELMGPSMLIFETAGVTLLCGMIALIALAARRGRFEDAIPVDRDSSGHQHGRQ